MWTRRHFLRLLSTVNDLEIRPRDLWAIDRPPLQVSEVEEVRFLLVHHSASSNEYVEEDVPGILQGFFDYHTSPEKGWSDIAYNVLIDRFGGVWEGRAGSLDGPVVPDATGGNQGFSQLVCLIGDFNVEAPTVEALSSLVSVLAWMADRFEVSTLPGADVTFVSRGSSLWAEGVEVTTPTISGHRDMSITSCPGEFLYGYVVGDLTSDVDGLRIPPTTTTTQPATTTTAPTTTTSGPTSMTPAAAGSTTAQTPIEFASDSSSGLWLRGLGAGAIATALAWVIRRRMVRKAAQNPNDL